MLNIVKRKQLRTHIQASAHLLAAVLTGIDLSLEANPSLTAEELRRFQGFWQRQLSDAIAELTTARRITEVQLNNKKCE